MNNYKEHLQKLGYSSTTVESYFLEVRKFIKWCARNHTNPTAIDYKTCLKYIQYLTRKGNSKKTINHKLGSLKNHLDYLVSENYRIDNPIENTNVKGVKRTINYNLLEADELEDLYYSFETENIKDPYHKLTAKRNKIIVGLMAYQGLNTTNLKSLKIEHVELYKGKIYIPSHKKMNARTMELKSWQVVELLEYINEVRPEIVKRKKVTNQQLLVPNNNRLSNTIYHIIRQLKRINNKVTSINQLRASVITNWLKQYNLRQAQYLAGHRYISSTERYLQDDLENLHEIVNNFHPIS